MSTMNRRGFLSILAGTPVVALATPEMLLDLLKPAKTIMLPPAMGWPTKWVHQSYALGFVVTQDEISEEHHRRLGNWLLRPQELNRVLAEGLNNAFADYPNEWSDLFSQTAPEPTRWERLTKWLRS